ncbi:RSP_7527 family protein [Oceaniglobus trochenteri]|nr:hypothetical protein [Oceaniglobus trochenteri]
MTYNTSEIEARARALRAEATRAGLRAMRLWIAARFSALTHPRRRAQHG